MQHAAIYATVSDSSNGQWQEQEGSRRHSGRSQGCSQCSSGGSSSRGSLVAPQLPSHSAHTFFSLLPYYLLPSAHALFLFIPPPSTINSFTYLLLLPLSLTSFSKLLLQPPSLTSFTNLLLLAPSLCSYCTLLLEPPPLACFFCLLLLPLPFAVFSGLLFWPSSLATSSCLLL